MTNQNEIHSVSEFLDRIISMYSQYRHTRVPDVSSITLYRGQSNSQWQLAPRLYREGLFDFERTLIEEFQRINPHDFDGLSLFDRLVKMQHYGLPTRLIDMTTNPLVALFFACHGNEQSGDSGNVFILPGLPVFRPDNAAVKLNAQYIFHHSGNSINLVFFVEELKRFGIVSPDNSLEKAVAFVHHYLVHVPYLAVLPVLRNPRISVQEGAFLLCGMKERPLPTKGGEVGGHGYVKFYSPFDLNQPLNQIWHQATSVTIEPENKARILSELGLLGISKGRMFPELENQAEHVVKSVRDGGTLSRHYNSFNVGTDKSRSS